MRPPRTRFYEEIWFKVWATPIGLLVFYLLLQFIPGGTLASWLVDGIAVAMMFLGVLALASQFVLPVRTLRERRMAYERMLEYVTSMHGPIIFVRDGEMVGNTAELKRWGMGVILVDGSSAIVLERRRRFSRAEGPGIVFTKYGERMAATFDLRKQSRGLETQALTKDGIEIKANISVTFALDPGEQVPVGETPDERDVLSYARITPAFPFNADSAFKAFYGYAVTDNQRMIKWNELPTIVATEYFRDLVNRETLDGLFLPKDPQSSPVSALQTRLTSEVQNAHLLRERGIKIYSVSIGALEMPPEVMRQRMQSWASHWEKEALIVLSDAQADAERIKERARADVQSEILKDFRNRFEAFRGSEDAPTKQELARRIVEELNHLTTDPLTRMLIPHDTLRRIDNIRTWVELPEPQGQPHVIGATPSEDLSEIVGEDIPGEDDSMVITPINPDSPPPSDAHLAGAGGGA
jgi:regulator of protease activity HflC (stomatin/prohibitin superfamily)